MQPPELSGYRPVRLLGSGGYSDVFLYEQEMPKREVAIKVLFARGLGDAGSRQFYAEANAMAAVSTHPYIVTVFDAQVSSSGHPYLVMEFYPRPNFSLRARNEKIPVPDVLRTGIQVASAVETAHRAGILHRDIKPANILSSEYNRPGLTDFGIATSATEGGEAEGMSIPWSPPEILNASAVGNETADVYSLAATIYTLLAGRSPFEVPGGSNRQLDLVQRIDRGGPPPTGRDDVPDSLDRVLRHGMSRSALDRPESAQHLARMLQSVEIELGLPPTQLEVREDNRDVWIRNDEPDADGTRLKNPVVIRSQDSPRPASGSMVSGAPPVYDATATQRAGTQPDDGTVHPNSTVHRGPSDASSASLISGIGARPVGLSGMAAPRPVSPIPSGAASPVEGGVVATDIPAATSRSTPSESRATSTIVKVAWVVLAVVAALVIAKVVVGAGTSSNPTDTTRTTTGNTLPEAGAVRPPTPTNVTVTPGPDGSVAWEHAGQDPAEFSYSILDIANGAIVGTADGVTNASIANPPQCVRVIATPKGGGQSSVENTDVNTNCAG